MVAAKASGRLPGWDSEEIHMSEPKPYWFPAKRYGWGWGPPDQIVTPDASVAGALLLAGARAKPRCPQPEVGQ